MFTRASLAQEFGVTLERLNKFYWFFVNSTKHIKIETESGQIRKVKRYDISKKDLEILRGMLRKDQIRETMSKIPHGIGKKYKNTFNRRG